MWGNPHLQLSPGHEQVLTNMGGEIPHQLVTQFRLRGYSSVTRQCAGVKQLTCQGPWVLGHIYVIGPGNTYLHSVGGTFILRVCSQMPSYRTESKEGLRVRKIVVFDAINKVLL